MFLKLIVPLCFCCRHTSAHAHSRDQCGRAPSAGLWLRLHSSTRLRPAATAQLWLWHVNTPHTPATSPITLLPSVLLFVFLTSFPWSSTHNRGHKQATAHSRFEWHFFIMLCCYKEITQLHWRTFICVGWQEIGPRFFVFSHSIFMTYLECCFSFCVCLCHVFYWFWFVQKWTC